MKEDKRGFSHYGEPAKGCRYCVRGEKVVLFITGLCGQRCHYCPISEKKFGKDVIYANEWKIESDKDLLEEIRLTEAKGAGITGGDPLVKIDKTCRHIKFLKDNMGERFHIHLYTPLKLADKKNLKKLYDAGLDEIRFHPDIDDEKRWDKIENATKHGWDVGIEIPCIPEKRERIMKLIEQFAGKIKFVNLNELEFSDTEVKHYNLEGQQRKDSRSYATAGSEELAKDIIKAVEKKGLDLSVYYCSAMLKDRTQMGNRIKKRAKQVTKPYDIVTKEGMLIRGVLYLEELKPGFRYHEKLANLEKEERSRIIKRLEEKAEEVKKIGVEHLDIDREKLRIILPRREIKKNLKDFKKAGLVPAIVEEYPTKDSVEIEVELF